MTHKTQPARQAAFPKKVSNGRVTWSRAWRGRYRAPARPALQVQGTCEQLMEKRRSSMRGETGSGRATPVARERNPTAPRVPKRRTRAAERRTPTRRHADTPIRRYADTPIRGYADHLTRRHAATPTRRHADTPTRRHADTPIRFSRRPL